MFRSDQLPKISILIAARNEEANILRCMQSVTALDYPSGELEVIIGDDGSDDSTADIINQYITGRPEFRYVLINQSVTELKGKTNVLAQLARMANGDYYFFCDADIAVNPNWLHAMLAGFSMNTGVVVGVTRMKKGRLFNDFLSLEWMLAMLITRFFSLLNIPITALGNNMAVSREAYFVVGGYEKIGFSIVGDYALFMAVIRHGYQFSMLYNPGVLSESEPLESLGAWVLQRRRWMQGVMESPWTTRLVLILTSLFIPLVLLASFWFPVVAFWLFFANYIFVTVITIVSVVILRQYDLWTAVPIFWFYLLGSTSLMLVNYFVSGKITWKGRTY